MNPLNQGVFLEIIPKNREACVQLITGARNFFKLNAEDDKRVRTAAEDATNKDNEQSTSYGRFMEDSGLDKKRAKGQPVDSQNYLNDAGCPDGGFAEARGLSIRWQKGSLIDANGEKVEPNGCFLLTVLEACANQLAFYESTKFACPENQEALAHLNKARDVLERRIKERYVRGVMGTHDQ